MYKFDLKEQSDEEEVPTAISRSSSTPKTITTTQERHVASITDSSFLKRKKRKMLQTTGEFDKLEMKLMAKRKNQEVVI